MLTFDLVQTRTPLLRATAAAVSGLSLRESLSNLLYALAFADPGGAPAPGYGGAPGGCEWSR